MKDAPVSPTVSAVTATDAVARIVEQWRDQRPDLDASPMLVLGRLARADAAVDAALRPPFAAAGLASGDFDVLAALRRQGTPYSATPTALAAATMVTQGATTKRVDRLAAQGLVTRAATRPEDGRVREVRLTADGVRLVDRLLAEHLATEEALLAALGPDERATLADLLHRLAESARTHTERTSA